MTTPTHVPATTLAHRLHDILRWKTQYTPEYRTVQAIRYDTDRRGTTETALPFPTDSIETDGAQGVETVPGVNTWVELWASWLSWALNQPTGKADGSWLLKQLQENKHLHPLPNPTSYEDSPDMTIWAERFLEEWDKFAQELTRLWWKLAHATGHAPLTRALCPKCKTGWLQSPPGQRGYTDTATCTNPECATIIDYNHQEILNSFRAALRDPNIPETYYLTIEELRTIWPRIKPSTLRSRAANNQIRKQNDRYNLADINTWMLDKHRQ